jgi:acetyl esterase
MAEHGTTVETKRYPSMAHGFFNIVGVGREARGYAAEIAEKLGTALQAG